MSRFTAVIACVLMLSGCGYANAVREDPAHHLYQVGAVLLGLDLVSITTTGKTLDDHIISSSTGQDCSTVRLSQGGPYCMPLPQPVAMVTQTTYCYKSLASASCFDAPLPGSKNTYLGTRTEMVPAP